MPYFSILIPVYNQVDKMDACVSSILEQTFGDFEVIFVNDGSTDDSLSMLNGYAAKDPRFPLLPPSCPPFLGTPHALLLHRPHAFPQPRSVAQQRWEPGQVHGGLQNISGGPRLRGHDGHRLPAWGWGWAQRKRVW